jgi:hypothetical protein
MFTNEDLENAIDKGIFPREKVEEFRGMLERSRQGPSVDEENFRLISGFNDIFVVIACCLFLFSANWIISAVDDGLSYAVILGLSWVLTEYFVRKRKMALPAIVLLIFFASSSFLFGISLFDNDWKGAPAIAGILTLIATTAHWFRFRVPITVAAGTGALVVAIISTLAYFFPENLHLFAYLGFFCGLMVFFLAMHWDRRDLDRTSHQADVAFWLHLLAAPLMVHSVFYILGIFDGNMPFINTLTVILLYFVLTTISLIIDRRAFMVSALAYVVYAMSQLFQSFGEDSLALAATGVTIGLGLLVLSAFWKTVRRNSLALLPNSIRIHVPPIG